MNYKKLKVLVLSLGSRHIVYPESGVYFFQDGEHLGVKSADDSGSDDVGFIRNEGRPVRAVRSSAPN